MFLIFSNILDWEHYRSSLLFPTDKVKEKILKEFLNKLASIDIKEIDDIVDLEQSIDVFIESVDEKSKTTINLGLISIKA